MSWEPVKPLVELVFWIMFLIQEIAATFFIHGNVTTSNSEIAHTKSR